MIAGYIRVSTRQQNYDAQRQAIEKSAAARGEEIGEWFADTLGGHRMKRPELVRLREAVRLGRFEKLYVFRIDRLSRAGISDTFGVIDEMTRAGCPVVSVADAFGSELSGPFRDILLAVLAWAAQMERSALNDRLHAARVRLESRGVDWGRPKVLPADTIRLALEAIAGGKSMRAAARELGISKTTLQRALARKPKDLERALLAAQTADSAS